MAKREIEGDWILGWPDRKRATLMPSKDAEGRVIFARTPILDLEGLITPVDAYYIMAQLNTPDPVHPDDFTVSLSGEVDHPREYGLEDLRKLPGRTVRAVTECAGNDGEFFDYIKEGSEMKKPSLRVVQKEEGGWNQMSRDGKVPSIEDILDTIPSTGMVSGGEWSGVALREVLDRAGVKPGAVAVRFEGWDEGKPDPVAQYLSVGRTDFEVFDPGIINYEKALPIEKAMDADTILAWAHNGEFLTHVHGAPLRLVVPGWAGNWWVKWIRNIEIMNHMPHPYYQTHYFVDGDSPEDPNKEMMTALGVKTLIKYPRDDDSPLNRGSHAIRGLAWSGEGAVVRVEVSTDGGETWHDAHVEESSDRWLWVRWSHLWEVDARGEYKIMARATDEHGRVQPQTKPNFQRKHFDGIVAEIVMVE